MLLSVSKSTNEMKWGIEMKRKLHPQKCKFAHLGVCLTSVVAMYATWNSFISYNIVSQVLL